jgi:hypothetical protein
MLMRVCFCSSNRKYLEKMIGKPADFPNGRRLEDGEAGIEVSSS